MLFVRMLYLLPLFGSAGEGLWDWMGQGESIYLGDAFHAPVQFDFDHDRNLYVADPKAGRIFKIDPSGRVLLTFGHQGQGPGELQYVADLSVDRVARKVWAIDYRARKLCSFDLNGNWLKDYPIPDGSPRTLHVAADSNLVLSLSAATHALWFFDEQAQPKRGFGYAFTQKQTPNEAMHYNLLTHISEKGRLYTATWRGSHLAAYNHDGEELWRVQREWSHSQPPVPFRFEPSEGRIKIKSSTWNVALFEFRGVLFVASDEEEGQLFAFDPNTGKPLGSRDIEIRIRNARVFQNSLYLLESQESVLHVFPFGTGPNYRSCAYDEDQRHRLIDVQP